MSRLEGVVDPENDFPRRPLGEKKLAAWIREHNPHEVRSDAWYVWNFRLLLDQSRASLDPSRSRSMWVTRYIFTPILAFAIVANLTAVTIWIVRLAGSE